MPARGGCSIVDGSSAHGSPRSEAAGVCKRIWLVGQQQRYRGGGGAGRSGAVVAAARRRTDDD